MNCPMFLPGFCSGLLISLVTCACCSKRVPCCGRGRGMRERLVPDAIKTTFNQRNPGLVLLQPAGALITQSLIHTIAVDARRVWSTQPGNPY